MYQMYTMKMTFQRLKHVGVMYGVNKVVAEQCIGTFVGIYLIQQEIYFFSEAPRPELKSTRPSTE